MAKLTLNDLSSLENQASAISLINSNNTLAETALENTLSLDGTAPNSMEADLDMNSKHILNLPTPVEDTEPVRLMDIDGLIGGGSPPVINLDDLLDVTITSVANSDLLQYNSGTGKWINSTLTSGDAPSTADYIVKTANVGLSAERVATDTSSVTWDFGTAGQAKLSRAALTGDVTATAGSNATTIANDAVTYAKMQNVSATDRLLGRDSSGAGDVEELTVAGGVEFTGSAGIQRSALTGDITATAGSAATTIANDAVTLAKMANIATSHVIGRTTAGTGDPEALTGAQVGGLITLNDLSDVVITSATTGDIPQYNGSNWVNAGVGSFGAPSSADYLVKTADAGLSAERAVTDTTSIVWDWSTGGQAKATRAALTGDVTASANANATTIANDAVTYAKMQNVSAASKLLGRGSASGSGDAEEITLGTGLSMSSTTLNASLSGVGGAPDSADYLVKTANAGLSAERAVTDTTSITWDWTTAGQAKANLAVAPWSQTIACSDETTALTTGTAKVTFRLPHAVTLTGVRASLTTAQTSGNIFTVDINEAGTSVISTKLTIDNSELTSTTAATPAVISDSALADDASITIDIDQIGDGTAKGLKVTLSGTFFT